MTLKDTRSNTPESSNDGLSAIDYKTQHDYDVKMALRRLQTLSTVASNSRAPLLSLLSTSGQSYHLPHVVFPREFRRKHLSANTKVVVGNHIGSISKELGRGTYGVVVLMKVDDSNHDGTIALKAQSPTDCLAWEYEILKRVEDRTVSQQPENYAFPKALSFISLADGAMLSMTTGSNSGLNLVDLVNVYKTKLGEPVPEIIALHYTSRMLKHLELLHWHGKILVSWNELFRILIMFLLSKKFFARCSTVMSNPTISF